MRVSGLRDEQIGGMGYVVGYRVATENLKLGRDVVADTVNPWQLTRDEWRRAALDAGARSIDVEIVCSDRAEHRRRVESRSIDIDGFKLPTWRDVLDREYHPWDKEPLRIDTSKTSVDVAVLAIRQAIGR